MSEGVRPRKLWHWGVVAVIAATVWANPGGTVEVIVVTLDAVGSTVGGAMERGGLDGETAYFEPSPQTRTESELEGAPQAGTVLIDPAPSTTAPTPGEPTLRHEPSSSTTASAPFHQSEGANDLTPNAPTLGEPAPGSFDAATDRAMAELRQRIAETVDALADQTSPASTTPPTTALPATAPPTASIGERASEAEGGGS